MLNPDVVTVTANRRIAPTTTSTIPNAVRPTPDDLYIALPGARVRGSQTCGGGRLPLGLLGLPRLRLLRFLGLLGFLRLLVLLLLGLFGFLGFLGVLGLLRLLGLLVALAVSLARGLA